MLKTEQHNIDLLGDFIEDSQKGGHLVFVEVHSPVQRDRIIEQLKERLEFKDLSLMILSQPMERKTPLFVIKDALKETKDEVSAVFLLGFDDLLQDEEIRKEHLFAFNMSREGFLTVEPVVVFWLRPFALNLIVQRSPDIWNWRSLVVRFEEEEAPAPAFELPITSFSPGDHKKAKEMIKEYEKLLERAKQAGYPLGRITKEILVPLAHAYYDDFQYEKALSLYEECLESIDEKDRFYRAMLLFQLGIIHHFQGDDQKAVDLYEKSLKIWEALGDKKSFASVLNLVGIHHHVLGHYQKAGDLFEKSLKIWEKLGNKWGIASTLHLLGVLHHLQSDYKRALELYEKSQKIYEELGDKWDIAAILINLGDLYNLQGDYKKASELYEKSLKISVELGYKSGIASTFHNLGIVHQRQGDYQRASELYDKSLKIREELRDRRGIALTFCQRGRLMEETGDLEEAERLLTRGLELFKDLGAPEAAKAEETLDRVRAKLEASKKAMSSKGKKAKKRVVKGGNGKGL